MDTFLNIASHELRTPLTSIMGNVQLAEIQCKRLAMYSAVSPEEVIGNIENACVFLGRARRQFGRLNRLIDELLNVSRIQAKKLTLHVEQCNLASVVQEAVEEQRQVNPARNIRLEVQAEAPVLVLADADRIGQVITNYLTNALKYAPASRPIVVGLQVEGQNARVSVQDEGPGLPLEEQERVWERFYRVSGIEVQSGSQVGLGLGLYICRALIEQHKGQVGVQSKSGHGSTFWFLLPLAQPDNW
jgi:signal transduction histidine kinase